MLVFFVFQVDKSDFSVARVCALEHSNVLELWCLMFLQKPYLFPIYPFEIFTHNPRNENM